MWIAAPPWMSSQLSLTVVGIAFLVAIVAWARDVRRSRRVARLETQATDRLARALTGLGSAEAVRTSLEQAVGRGDGGAIAAMVALSSLDRPLLQSGFFWRQLEHRELAVRWLAASWLWEDPAIRRRVHGMDPSGIGRADRRVPAAGRGIPPAGPALTHLLRELRHDPRAEVRDEVARRSRELWLEFEDETRLVEPEQLHGHLPIPSLPAPTAGSESRSESYVELVRPPVIHPTEVRRWAGRFPQIWGALSRRPGDLRPGGMIAPGVEFKPAPHADESAVGLAPVADDAAHSGDDPDVGCSVYAPHRWAAGEEVLVQVFLHPLRESPTLLRIAAAADAETRKRATQGLRVHVPIGVEVEVELQVSGVGARRLRKSVTWRGMTEHLTFAVAVPSDARPARRVAFVRVALSGIPVGEVAFSVRTVAASASPSLPQPAGDRARRYETAFISYASRDRTVVIERMQVLTALGIRYFNDLLDLEPGDRWRRRLFVRIRTSDLFLLFWSNAARESRWVLKEIRYADRCRRRRGAPEIRPILIEGPPVPPPPAELRDLHFDDKLLYVSRHPS